MVALSVAFYARLSVGSRQVVEIFNILNEFMGGMFGKVPAYNPLVTGELHQQDREGYQEQWHLA